MLGLGGLLALKSSAAAGAVAARKIPGYPTNPNAVRTRRPELAVRIFPADGQANWPFPLRDSRRDSCPALQALAAQAWPQTWAQPWVQPWARISARVSAQASVQHVP